MRRQFWWAIYRIGGAGGAGWGLGEEGGVGVLGGVLGGGGDGVGGSYVVVVSTCVHRNGSIFPAQVSIPMD